MLLSILHEIVLFIVIEADRFIESPRHYFQEQWADIKTAFFVASTRSPSMQQNSPYLMPSPPPACRGGRA